MSSIQYHYTEPYVAAHPSNPDVWAVGAMAAHVYLAGADASNFEGFPTTTIHTWFTQDGGATWRFSEPPPIIEPATHPNAVWTFLDPVLIIDEAGVTHLTGLYETADVVEEAATPSVLYVNSMDFGRTWGEPVTLSGDGFNDRNWMLDRDGVLFVNWLNFAGEGEHHVAYSEDRGATWTRVVDSSCWRAGPMASVDEAAIVSCRVGDLDDASHMIINQWTGNGWTNLARLPGDCHMPFVAQSGVGYVWAPRGCSSAAHAVWSYTNEINQWPEPTPIGELVGRQVDAVAWQSVDAWGLVHWLTVTDRDGETPDDHGGNLDRSQIDYVVLEPSRRTVVLDARLRDSVPDPDTRVPENLAPGGSRFYGMGPWTGDHYYGIASVGERTGLAWSDAGAIHVAFAEANWDG